MMLIFRFLLSLAVALAVGAAAAAPSDTAKAVDKDARWLAIQTADSASYDGRRLTLHGTNGSVVLFTDRPYRTAESMSNTRFIGAWDKGGKHSFAKEPPNAAISMFVDGKSTRAVVVLSDPRIDGRMVSYAVEVIEGVLPANGTGVSLFIDDVCLSCW